LFGALLANYPRRQPDHRSESWVPSEGPVGVVLDLLQVLVGVLPGTTNATPRPLGTFAHLPPPPHPKTMRRSGPPHPRSMTPGGKISPALVTSSGSTEQLKALRGRAGARCGLTGSRRCWRPAAPS